MAVPATRRTRAADKTAYLWEEVLERRSLLDILARFIHLQVEEKRLGSKKVKRETMIFPRYHQLDCVRKLVARRRRSGARAPTTWSSTRRAAARPTPSPGWPIGSRRLHDAQDEKVFDSVVVVTDRVVLDQQLQNTIYQFEHKQGVVQKIDGTRRSSPRRSARRADHHHDPPEVPLRHREDRRPAASGGTRSSSTRPTARRAARRRPS